MIDVVQPRPMCSPLLLLLISRERGNVFWYEYTEYFKSFQFLHCLAWFFFLYSMESCERSGIKLSTVVALEALSEY